MSWCLRAGSGPDKSTRHQPSNPSIEPSRLHLAGSDILFGFDALSDGTVAEAQYPPQEHLASTQNDADESDSEPPDSPRRRRILSWTPPASTGTKMGG